MLRKVLLDRGLLRDERLMKAFLSVDRNLFKHPVLQDPIDHGIQIDLLGGHLKPGHHVLDCGSGSGFLTCVFANLVLPPSSTDGFVVAVDRETEYTESCIERIASTFNSDRSILSRIFMLPVDASEPVYLPQAPYDAIRVGFQLPGIDDEATRNLTVQLKKGGRMIAHTPEHENKMTIFDKDDSGNIQISHTTHESLAIPLPLKKLVAVDKSMEKEEVGDDKNKKSASSGEQLKKDLQEKLHAWRVNFEKQHNRRPTRQDMFEDPYAAQLFQQFSRI